MLFLIFHIVWVATVSARCYEPNVAHPLPVYEAASDDILKAAFARINTALTKALNDPKHVNTSFSIEVTSSKESLWSTHHTAQERNSSRPDVPQVNGDALYRIASITKTFTVLGVLYQHAAGNLSLDDPINTYIEELRDGHEGSIPWKDITLRSLASQLSGIPREFAQADLINLPSYFPFTPEQLGFPPASRKGLLKCDEYGDNFDPPCDRSDLIKSIKTKAPVFAPNQKSTYSNVAFELLGLVVANITGQTYEEYVENAIFKPLSMTKSSLSQPPDSAGVIPLGYHYWDVDEGIQNPAGCIYSSSIDLSSYLRYILTHYNGITHTLNWANPASPARGLYSFYGTPWEIYHTDRVLINSKRMVRFITKGGGLPGYTSVIMTVPEYDLGITILVAGPNHIFEELQEVVTRETVRAAEKVAIRQLQERYVGTYISPKPDLNSSLTLVADYRGLVIKEWVSNSTDLLNSPLFRLAGAPKDRPWYAQLVPTLLYRNETAEDGERWRMQVASERIDTSQVIWDEFCPTDVDIGTYAGEPANEFVFWNGKERAAAVGLPGFRVKLVRKEDSDVQSRAKDQEILEL